MSKQQNPKNKYNLRFHGTYVPAHERTSECKSDCNNKPPSGDKTWEAYNEKLRQGYIKYKERLEKELLLEKENNVTETKCK